MILAAVLALPLSGGILSFVVPRGGRWLGLATGLATAIAVFLLVLAVGRGSPLTHHVGGWGPPLGISLRADGLAALMLLMTALTALPAAIYAAGFFGAADPRSWTPGESFWPLALFLWAALNALFLSADVFNLYVALELMTVAAVALVLLGGGEAALTGAIRYLLAAFLASMLYLLGVGVLYAAYGALDLSVLTEAASRELATLAAAALMTAALVLKTALFPLHFWLPRAHAAAPAPVSALLSSLVVTASFYVLLRLWTGVFAPVFTPSLGHFLGALGTGAMLWGSIQAIRQQHLKVMVAYSTVAQIGYLFLLFPLISSALAVPGGIEAWGRDAWNGGVYHALSHALAKGAMFLAAGTIAQALGHDRIVGISGIARQLPLTTYAFGIAGMTLIGLPPSGGFVAKWLLLSAAFASGQWWWAVAMLLTGILTAGYVFLVLGQELSLASSDREVRLKPVSRSMEIAAMALALAALVLGVRVTEPLALLSVGLPFGGE